MATTLLSKDSVKVCAEALGIVNLGDDVAMQLAPDVEYRLRDIVQEAIKFAKHSKRSLLTTTDVNNALRLRNVEMIYGFSSQREPLRFTKVPAAGDLYYIEDRELDLRDVINQPLPAPPRCISFTGHWLAIDGVQPRIPQNPAPPGSAAAAADAAAAAAAAAATAAGGGAMVLAGDDQQARKRKFPERTGLGGTAGGGGGGVLGESSIAGGNVDVRPQVKHMLSRELQTYYSKVTEAIRGENRSAEPNGLQHAALNSLALDPGLSQLVPYFCQFIAEEVTQNIRNTALLFALMRTVEALLHNPYLYVEPYLHQLLPAVITCVVGKRLCSRPTDNHWALRDFAAAIVGKICRKYGLSYSTLQPRVTKTLLHAFLDPARPLTTHYGAIRGLAALGNHVVGLLLLPNLNSYVADVLRPPRAKPAGRNKAKRLKRDDPTGADNDEEEEKKRNGGNDDGDEAEDDEGGAGDAADPAARRTAAVGREELIRVQAALLDAAGGYVVQRQSHTGLVKDVLPEEIVRYTNLAGIFGEALLIYTSSRDGLLDLWL